MSGTSVWYSPCALVFDGVEQPALLLVYVLAVARRAWNEDVTGDDDGSGVQPTAIQDALQVGQVGGLVVFDEQEVELAGGEAVLVGQCVEGMATVARWCRRRT